MRHRIAVTSQFLCSRVQCGNATQLRRSINWPLHAHANCIKMIGTQHLNWNAIITCNLGFIQWTATHTKHYRYTEIACKCCLPYILGGHLYSKVDIVLKYKNLEKGCFFKERHIPHGPCLGYQKHQKSRKRYGFFFRLIKIQDKGMFLPNINMGLVYNFELISLIRVWYFAEFNNP